MSDLTPAQQWVGTVQLEIADIVIGGAGGKSNEPHQDLTDRTEYIYDALFAAGTPLATAIDFQIAGDTDANLIYVDVSADNIGIGTGTPAATRKFDLLTSLLDGVYSITSSSSSSAAGVTGIANATGAVGNFGGVFQAFGDSGIGIQGQGIATGAVGNFGAKFFAAGDSGIAALCSASATGAVTNYGIKSTGGGDSGVGVWGQTISVAATGSAFGLYGTTSSTSSTSAGVRGDGIGANSHDFLALNNEYDAVSMKSVKIGKQDVNIPDMIREYSNWHIQRYSYKYNSKFRELITPYADEFQEAFELTEAIDNENINNAVVAGVAFGGVVQLVKEIDVLKKRIEQLERGV